MLISGTVISSCGRDLWGQSHLGWGHDLIGLFPVQVLDGCAESGWVGVRHVSQCLVAGSVQLLCSRLQGKKEVMSELQLRQRTWRSYGGSDGSHLKSPEAKNNFSRWIKLFPWYRNVEHGTPQGCERRPFLFNLLTRTSAAQHVHRWVSGDWDKSETSGRGEVGRAVSRITTAPEPPPAHGGVSSTYILSKSLTRHIQHRMHFL